MFFLQHTVILGKAKNTYYYYVNSINLSLIKNIPVQRLTKTLHYYKWFDTKVQKIKYNERRESKTICYKAKKATIMPQRYTVHIPI